MFKCTYEGRQVAVKVPRVDHTSDFDSILGVSILPVRILHRFERLDCRGSTEKRLLGNTSSIQISCRCLV